MKTAQFLLFIVLFIALFIYPAHAQFAGGEGTSEEPYEIETLEQLQEMGAHRDAHFVLVNDIDATETETWNDGEGFMPINHFDGSFNGDGYVISGLMINRPSVHAIGFFARINENAHIKNVRLEDINITGTERVGGLTGRNNGGTIENSYTSGVVTGDESLTGGLVATNSGTITQSHSSCDVSGNQAGGLVGLMNSGELSYSYATGTVSWNDGVARVAGGLVATNTGGEITNSFATGNVTGNTVGGLVGRNSETISYGFATGNVQGFSEPLGDNTGGLAGNNSGEIIASYATGNVNGDRAVGGLVGDNVFGSVSDSYSTGEVTGESDVGGLLGRNDSLNPNNDDSGEVANSYWNTVTSGLTSGNGSGSDTGISGLTTTEMKQQDSFSNWDFEDTWTIEEGSSFPWLQTNPQDPRPGEESSTNVPGDDKNLIPNEVILAQNYPNPFNPVTTISYQLPAASEVRLDVYDILGRRVATLVNDHIEAGHHTVTFDASGMASGTYLYRIQTGDISKTGNMMLIK